jgi:battenin
MAGAVLAADIIPTLIIKSTAPFWAHLLSYKVRIMACAAFSVIAFLLTGFAETTGLRLLGVACASVSAGWGEVTMLALASFYPGASVLTAWSSGTGVAGVAGTGWYLLLHTLLGVPAPLTLKLGAMWAAVYIGVYLFVLPAPAEAHAAYKAVSAGDESLGDTSPTSASHNALADKPGSYSRSSDSESPLLSSRALQIETGGKSASAEPTRGDAVLSSDGSLEETCGDAGTPDVRVLSLTQRAKLLAPLWVFMLPLFVVYAAEYIIQIGVNSALEFPEVGLPAHKWYVIAGFLYQLGVFLSRSSGTVLPLKVLWPLPVLQTLALGVFLMIGFDVFSAPAWLVGLLTFGVGLLGGATCKCCTLRPVHCVPRLSRQLQMSMPFA